MKKIFTLFVIATILFGCSEEYDDSGLRNDLNDLENRVEKLEELCKQMNTNISSLQSIVTALQSNDYITSVSPAVENGRTIGYVISFAKNDPITVYHGSKGTDGTTPQIGVKQDGGIYYWTLNGEWLTDDQDNRIKAQGIDGTNGKSAYDLAVEKGYSGTLDEWLASLKGSNGNDGDDGKSAYELAVEKGYKGTLEEWLASLNGTNGDNGKSAYELAVEKGYNGTLDEWLESLKGSNGNNGNDGNDGKSAYELAVEKGYKGTLEEWLESLKGINGINGITPKLKIENGRWLLSMNGGETWEDIGQATGEDGKDGKDGIFKSVDEDDKNVYFTLSDNTVIAVAKGTAQADVYTVHLESKGDLANQISYADLLRIRSLKVTGEMNEADFQVICKSMPYLKTLDLSEINNTVLPDKCFYESYNVRHIILPETLISIGAQMFENSALEDVLIPVNVKKIGAAAFRNCSSLENVTFAPNSTLHTIETGAFHGCSVLKTIKIPASVETMEDLSFHECRQLEEVIWDNELKLTKLNKQIFGNCISLSFIVIPANVREIAPDAFNGCSSLSAVIFDNNSQIEVVDGFQGCGLKSIRIPQSVHTIKHGAFNNCSSLESVVFDENIQLKVIDGFPSCSSLKNIEIPASVDSIARGAFSGAGLKEIFIPQTVKSIEASAFANCRYLESVTFDKNSQVKVIKGGTAQVIYTGTFYGCSALKNITLPASVDSIGKYAFLLCKSLQAVDASACVNLKGVGEQAFLECDNLTLFKVGALYPPQCEDNNFSFPRDSHAALNSVLQVPSGQISYYSSSEGWKNFHSIIELSN